jgi:hypothetical protein
MAGAHDAMPRPYESESAKDERVPKEAGEYARIRGDDARRKAPRASAAKASVAVGSVGTRSFVLPRCESDARGANLVERVCARFLEDFVFSHARAPRRARAECGKGHHGITW